MQCCTQYCAAEAKFNGKVAQRDLRRYHRRGPDVTTRLLLAELRRCPLEGASVLDIGSGIGVIDTELADSSVGSATVVEASPAYFEVSRNELESRYGVVSEKSIVLSWAVLELSCGPTDMEMYPLRVFDPFPGR